jgi:DMSO/TMAO reductase YedYZ heme-binding membrane subunit
MSFKAWRTIHFFNIGLYFVVIIHAFYLGTDMKNETVRSIFLYANLLLILLMLNNMFFRIKANIARKNAAIQNQPIQ